MGENMANRQARRPRSKRIPVGIVAALITAAAAIIAAFIGLWPQRCQVFSCPAMVVRVTNDQSEPIQGANVLLFSNAGAIQQYSDSNGIAEFSNASGLKNLQLVVESSQYAIYEQQLSAMAQGNLNVHLSPKQGSAGGVIFRVFDQKTGKPVPNADVQVYVGSELQSKATDSNGVSKFDLTFPENSGLDTSIIVQTQDYNIKNENITLYPNRVQDILLGQDKNSFEITSVQAASPGNAPNGIAVSGNSTDRDVITNRQVSNRVDPKTGFQVKQESAPNDNHNGELKIELISPDNKPLVGINTTVSTQKTDVNNQPLADQFVANQQTDDGGVATMQQIKPGTYAVIPDIAGYPWNALIFNQKISADQRTVLTIVPSQFLLSIHRADNTLLTGNYVSINTQKMDANGNAVSDQQVRNGNLNDAGYISFTVTPGRYAVNVEGLSGQDWGGNNIELPPATLVTYALQLGRIRVEARDADGKVQAGFYSHVTFERKDANGQSIPGDEITNGATDDSGIKEYDLTPGTYFVTSDAGQAMVTLNPGQTVVVKNSDLKKP